MAVDEYARSQQCFNDFQGPPFRFKDLTSHIQSTVQQTQSGELIQQSGLLSVPLPFPNLDLESADELDHGPDSYSSLLEDLQLSESCPFLGASGPREMHLPQETLDLGYDVVKDFELYSKQIHLKQHCNLVQEWLPLAHVDHEKDGGLLFPSSSIRWQALVLHAAKHEAIDSSKEAIGFIQQCIEGPSSPHNPVLAWKEQLKFDRVLGSGVEPVSPPMSPVVDDDDHFIPGPEVTIIDLTSEPSSPPSSSFGRIQDDIENGCLDSDLVAPSTIPSSPVPKHLGFVSPARRKSSALKLDIPITGSISPDTKGGDYFLQSMERGGLGSRRHKSPSSTLETTFDDTLTEIINDCHSRTIRIVEAERPNPTDSLLRVPIPVLSFDLPAPEQDAHLSSSIAQFTWLKSAFRAAFHLVQSEDLVRLGSSLRWTPVPPGGGYVSVEEEFEQLGAVSREYLTIKAPQLCSATFVPKTPSLSIIRLTDDAELEDDEGVEVECDKLSPAQDKGVTIRDPLVSQIQDSRSLAEGGLAEFVTSLRKRPFGHTAALLPGASSLNATNSLLSSFIELRQPKRCRTVDDSFKPKSSSIKAPRIPLPPLQSSLVDTTFRQEAEKGSENAPAPEYDIPPDRCSFIVSLGLGRSILSQLEKLWPHAELIDRDFTQYNTTTCPPSSAQSQGVVSSLAYEPDVVPSPSAGIVVTSLLKVKQKSLPGASSPTPLRDRIQHLSRKYESLFILVSEANPDGEYVGSLSDSDLAAYTDFVHFTTVLEAEVTTYFVCGAEVTLARWLVSLMCRFASQSRDLGRYLESTDTTWDMFFRRAGTNIYAAQVLAGILLAEYGNLGLAEFLAMDQETRIAKYAQIMGGQRVFSQVCGSLDKTWL